MSMKSGLSLPTYKAVSFKVPVKFKGKLTDISALNAQHMEQHSNV